MNGDAAGEVAGGVDERRHHGGDAVDHCPLRTSTQSKFQTLARVEMCKMSECAERLSRCGYHRLAVAFGRERVADQRKPPTYHWSRHAAVDDGPLAAAAAPALTMRDQAGTAVAVAKQIADVAVVGQVGVDALRLLSVKATRIPSEPGVGRCARFRS